MEISFFLAAFANGGDEAMSEAKAEAIRPF